MQDAYGLTVSAASAVALQRYDEAVRALLGWDGQATVRFQAAVAADEGLALAHAGLAICHFLDERLVDARAAVNTARRLVDRQSDRERSHVEAIAQLLRGTPPDAERAVRQHLDRYPRDLTIAQRLYFLCFWQGRFAEMLELTTDLLGRGGDGFLLGLHAFALEEADRFDAALAVAERALVVNPRDAWAVHAYAHTLYEMAAFDRGVVALPPAIHPCTHLGYFRRHLLWHLALMHLSDGRTERARLISRAVFEREPSRISGDLHDSISLLWRLQLCGADPGLERWAPFAAIAAQRMGHPGFIFHDVHLAMALAAGGEWTAAERQLEILRARVEKDRSGLVGEVAIPLVEGLHAFVGADYGRTIERIEPIQSRIVALGGSRAQRDVFHDTVLEACFRGGDTERAQRLLVERIARRPDRYWTSRRN
jgi:tetratricopeptide (TPR) repeat protein